MTRPKEIVFIIYSYLVGVIFAIMDVALIGVVSAVIVSSETSTNILNGLPSGCTVKIYHYASFAFVDTLSHLIISLFIYPILLPLIIHNRLRSLILVWLSAVYVEMVGLFTVGSETMGMGLFFDYHLLLTFIPIFLSMWAVTWFMRNVEKMAIRIKKGIDQSLIVKFILILFILSVALPVSVMLALSLHVTKDSAFLIIGRIIVSPVTSIIYFGRTSPVAFLAPIPVIGILYYAGHSLYKRLRDRPSLHV